ncbi:MAG: glycosyltransferase [Minisyncoccia bacterium]|jgi:glycosyltransferase involved in cell wall biosynthesis
MKICYFGDFDPEYARNRVIIRGLKENGADVLFCHTTLTGLKGLWDLFKKHRSLGDKYDILIVGYSDSRFIAPLAWLISDKKIIWDAFYSLYDSWVYDRKIVAPGSLKAKLYWFLDWVNCKLADSVLLDTNEHIKYFSKTFKTSNSKFLKVLVGTDDDIFYPREKDQNNSRFIVHFHGKFIPLQGLEYIIRAARILKNEKVAFRIIGTGQEYNRIKNLADELKSTNILWVGRTEYSELTESIKNADVCLGVFGDTPKIQRVIPNKVYESVAMRKPVISGNTPAIRELFTDGKNMLLCKIADPEDLAAKILELSADPDLRDSIAQKGYELFKEFATPQIIGQELIKNLGQFMKD